MSAPTDATADDISSFFERYGWRFERRGQDLFRTGFHGDTGQYEIWIRVADPWVYFTINPYVGKVESRDHGDAVYDLVLHANHDLNMAKFAIDSDGDVALSVEMPTEGFSYSQFADALTALALYADEYRVAFDQARLDDNIEVV